MRPGISQTQPHSLAGLSPPIRVQATRPSGSRQRPGTRHGTCFGTVLHLVPNTSAEDVALTCQTLIKCPCTTDRDASQLAKYRNPDELALAARPYDPFRRRSDLCRVQGRFLGTAIHTCGTSCTKTPSSVSSTPLPRGSSFLGFIR